MKSKYLAFGVRMKKSEFSKGYNTDGLFVKQIYLSPDPETIDRRKELAEHPFGTIKRSMDTGYLLTKGIQNATGEFSLAFLAYNLKRAINTNLSLKTLTLDGLFVPIRRQLLLTSLRACVVVAS